MDQRRKIESASEARRSLAAVERSGSSIKEWARAHGVDGRSLHAWKMNLERGAPSSARTASKAKSRSAIQLVELVPTTATPARYALRIGSVSVEFGDDFDAGTLRRVVGVLRSC